MDNEDITLNDLVGDKDIDHFLDQKPDTGIVLDEFKNIVNDDHVDYELDDATGWPRYEQFQKVIEYMDSKYKSELFTKCGAYLSDKMGIYRDNGITILVSLAHEDISFRLHLTHHMAVKSSSLVYTFGTPTCSLTPEDIDYNIKTGSFQLRIETDCE